MKILTITDKPGSAIDRLATMTNRRLAHLNPAQVSLHPKRPSDQELAQLRDLIKHADLIDFQYHKSAVMARKLFPELEKKIMVLTHHNEHNIEGEAEEWKQFKWHNIVVKNGWQLKKLQQLGIEATLIKHACEFTNFSYADKLVDEKVVAYIGQIKKVKGITQLAEACKQLGYKLQLTGSISEAGVWENLLQNYSETILIDGQLSCDDGELCPRLHKARVYCCNSDDGTESGTVPILEAMASGIPVVTRKIGLVRDCGEHLKNMFIRSGKYDDVEDLKFALQQVMEQPDLADTLRENAWRTVRQYHPEVQARSYDRLFTKTLYPEQTFVSVIMPTYNRAEALAENLATLNEQSHQAFEVVIADDGSNDNTERVVREAKGLYNFPIKYFNCGEYRAPARGQSYIPGEIKKDYGLPRARNMALIESIGEVVVFCDDRLKMHPMAIENFVLQLKKLEAEAGKKVWVWGSKGVFKSFVENFSASWRRSIIDGGGFNERINEYGGTTQEVSRRFAAQGFRFDFAPQCTAEPIFGTHSKSQNRQQIISSKIKLFKMGYQ